MLSAASFFCASAAAFGLTFHPAAPPIAHSLLVARTPRVRTPVGTAVDASGVTEPLSLSELPDPVPDPADPAPPTDDGASAVEINGLDAAAPELEEAAEDNLEALRQLDEPPISAFGIDQRIVDLLAGQGITNFTPIQAKSYKLLAEGADILGRSRTGTGKTLAFCLPLIARLVAEGRPLKRGRPTRMVVLAPTRELARQVAEVAAELGAVHGLRVELFHGGVPYPPQRRVLRDGLDVLVGTPGRIIDHLQNGELDLSGVHYAVLDEADEMLNMGFKEDVETILEATVAEQRQTVLFSATHPPWVRSVAREYLRSPVSVDAVGKGASEAATTVEHIAVLTPDSERARGRTLADVISVYGVSDSRTIVFTSTKREVDELCVSAALAPLGAQPLHGDVTQKQREITLSKFRDGHFPVLVATDVAARGIDISGVDLIVQFRLPNDADSFVHRSGRTGRAGREGTALLLYSERERRAVRDLERRANVNFNRVGAPSVHTVMEAAAALVPRRIATVDERILPYFEAAAGEMLAADDAHAQLAAALALVAGQSEVVQRSLITGEEHMSTLVCEATDGSRLSPADIVAAVSRLSREMPNESPFQTERGGDAIGKIRECNSPSQARAKTAP